MGCLVAFFKRTPFYVQVKSWSVFTGVPWTPPLSLHSLFSCSTVHTLSSFFVFYLCVLPRLSFLLSSLSFFILGCYSLFLSLCFQQPSSFCLGCFLHLFFLRRCKAFSLSSPSHVYLLSQLLFSQAIPFFLFLMFPCLFYSQLAAKASVSFLLIAYPPAYPPVLLIAYPPIVFFPLLATLSFPSPHFFKRFVSFLSIHIVLL